MATHLLAPMSRSIHDVWNNIAKHFQPNIDRLLGNSKTPFTSVVNNHSYPEFRTQVPLVRGFTPGPPPNPLENWRRQGYRGYLPVSSTTPYPTYNMAQTNAAYYPTYTQYPMYSSYPTSNFTQYSGTT